MEIKKDVFGKTDEGKEAEIFTLSNDNGITAKVTSYGATLVSLEIPDKNGKAADILLGFETLDEYVKDLTFQGCTVGRCANRILNGKFVLDGVEYTLATNDGNNHLHGGVKGFNKMFWDAESIQNDDSVGVKFTYLSEDGQENYPGNLAVTVIYTLTSADELKIEYEAETDKKTIINLTNHSYYNLAGAGSGTILNHEMTINADSYTETNDELLPTGQIKPVSGTDLDFTTPRVIGDRITNVKGGYDLNYVLNKEQPASMSFAARVVEPTSGRVMEVSTTEPGIQFYSSNFLDGLKGKAGNVYNQHDAFCLETQHFPDSQNQPSFPSIALAPGQKYKHLTVHRFLVQ